MTRNRNTIIAKVAMFVLIIALLAGCSKNWEEKYDLGLKYLEEGKYQEAIIAFSEAIDIDDKQPLPYVGRGDAYVLLDESFDEAEKDYRDALELDDATAGAYLGLADIYIRQGKLEDAIAILKTGLEKTGNNEELKSKLEEIEAGNVSDSAGNSRMMVTYDADRNIKWYYCFEYKDGKKSKVTHYDAGGKELGHVDIKYDDQGRMLQSYSSDLNDGTLFREEFKYDGGDKPVIVLSFHGESKSGAQDLKREMQYDAAGNEIKEIISFYDEQTGKWRKSGYKTMKYDSHGNLIESAFFGDNNEPSGKDLYEYDDSDRLTKLSSYNYQGKLQWYMTYEYDENGKTAESHYDGDGKLIDRSEY